MSFEIDETRLLRGVGFSINDKIHVKHPRLQDISEAGEYEYYSMVHLLTASPEDYKVGLFDDMGIYYDEISDFEFFCLMSRSFTHKKTSVLLGDLDLSKFSVAKNKETEAVVLYNKEGNMVIDEAIYRLIADFVRKLHGFEKKDSKPKNKSSRDYFISRERRRSERRKNEPREPIIAPLISALVNSPHFKYDYTTVWSLPIYAFTDSVKAIQKQKNYDQVMSGVYAGTVSFKDIDQDKISWLK